MPILAFLGKIFIAPLRWVGQWILSELITRIGAFVQDYLEQRKRNKELEDAMAKVTAAKTPEEQENAFKEVIRLRNRK